MSRQSLLALGLLLFTATAAFAQHPPPAPVLPPPLFVRFSGPAGVKVTFYRGGPTGHTFDTPCTVGLRPGYSYRVEVSGMPRFPGVKLYPELAVYGSLALPHHMKLADYPAAIHFRDEDFQSSLADALVTKAVALERPDTALPLATDANRPIEIDLPVARDPVKAALERGRPLLVFKFGGRQYSPQELAEQSVPGTVMLPGEHVLQLPQAPPWLPQVCYPYFDPILGPASPAGEICFWDGGDRGLPVGYGPDGRLRGLDPSDTVAEYMDSQQRQRIAVSNRVCLCVPRFVVFRSELQATTHLTTVGPNNTALAQRQVTVVAEKAPMVDVQNQHPGGILAGMKASISDAVQVTAVTGQVNGLDVIATLRVTNDVSATCAKPEAQVPEKLTLIKWPDRCAAAIGEIVTFFLKYTNHGGRPVTNVVVSDSLTNRLEYVPGSARADRDAVFTTQVNEAGSLILRWEVNEPLPPGQSGTVSFQVRVR
jgi:uncharacterized repeat protein (TIGR01451 family)